MTVTEREHPPYMPGYEQRVGRCYELSGRTAVFEHAGEAVLVHGTIQGLGFPRIGHAWIELDDGLTVHDPVTGWTVNADWYYEFAAADAEVRYRYSEAAAMVTEHEHWGPWHDDHPAPAEGAS